MKENNLNRIYLGFAEEYRRLNEKDEFDKGIKFYKYIFNNGFFDIPSSIKYHGIEDGGNLKHSYRIWKDLIIKNIEFNLNLTEYELFITAFFHDLCKIRYYKRLKDGSWTYKYPKHYKLNHAKLSLKILKDHNIEISPRVKKIILYHMGNFGTKEFSPEHGEYTFKSMMDNLNKDVAIAIFQQLDYNDAKKY